MPSQSFIFYFLFFIFFALTKFVLKRFTSLKSLAAVSIFPGRRLMHSSDWCLGQRNQFNSIRVFGEDEEGGEGVVEKGKGGSGT